MRITRKDLQYHVDRLNRILNRPTAGWTRLAVKASDGANMRANVGHFVLQGNSPGDGWTRYTLAMIINEGGGKMDVSPCCTLQEMDAYLAGVFSVLESTERWTGADTRNVFAKYPVQSPVHLLPESDGSY